MQHTAQNLLNSKALFEREKMEKDALAKQLKQLRVDSHRRISELEQRNQELMSDKDDLDHAVKNADIQRIKSHDKDERLRQLEVEKKNVESQNKILEAYNQKLQDSKVDAERKTESLRREIDHL